MNRSILIALAQGQLEASRNARRMMFRALIEGDLPHAALYRGSANLYLKAARLFLRDAHTEQYDRLRLRKSRR